MTEERGRSIRELLSPILPPIVFRNNLRLEELTGFSPRTLANTDSNGIAPRDRVKVGKVCGYPKDMLTYWLEGKMHYSRGWRCDQVG